MIATFAVLRPPSLLCVVLEVVTTVTEAPTVDGSAVGADGEEMATAVATAGWQGQWYQQRYWWEDGCCLGDVHLSLLCHAHSILPLERTEDLLVVEVAASAPGGGSAPHSSWWCPCTTSPVNTMHQIAVNSPMWSR